ncbi:SAM-dependent methyltransferase [Rhodoferax sp. UBA5149]|uniref:SAM-dependent methyltransferase n=1 Tax=Rhodoferax sp. UBA5149 TaxID=1947379 RepID=UPI0025DA9B19|nr:class I SAM-dependent methyltransferase [Rhodoferax sp. UBA5149]
MTTQPFTDAALTWNTRFKGDAYLFGTEPNGYLRNQAHWWKPGERVLCVADGEGRNSVWLAQQGLRVDAFDISEVGVRKAASLARAANVTLNLRVENCDSRVWLGDLYDGIAAIFVQFADPPMRERLFGNMMRSLKPGGILVLQGYTPKQLEYQTGGPPFIDHLYTSTMLQEAFASMQIMDLTEYEDDLAEGTQHHGRSALIGMVARKAALNDGPLTPARA